MFTCMAQTCGPFQKSVCSVYINDIPGEMDNTRKYIESVQVDPQLLFQTFITVGDRIGEFPSLFSYELCSYTGALFEAPSLPLKANKPALAYAIWKKANQEQLGLSDDVKYVLDGGALLHHLPWPCSSSCNDVYALYVDRVNPKYGKS